MLENLYHLLRYGTHSEKDFFFDSFGDGFYDGVLLNANMLAYSPEAMASFVLRLNKPFIIDPQTHAFQHDIRFLKNKDDKIKGSIQELADIFGEPIVTALASSERLKAADFSSAATQKSFSERIIGFQLSTLKDKVTSGSDAEYVNYALADSSSGLSIANVEPAAVVAPYLYITDLNIANLNVELLAASASVLSEKQIHKPLLAQLVISKDMLLNESSRNAVATAYNGATCDGILLWVDALDESEDSKEVLVALKKFIESLSENHRKIINLYGGYFSILLTKTNSDFVGVCHGMEYGESRHVVPVGGGLPRAKYYFYPLHKRLAAEDLIRIVKNRKWTSGSKNKEFAEEVCDCEQCANLDQFTETKTYKTEKRTGEMSTTAAKLHSLKHYLLNKKKEYATVKSKPISDLIAELSKNHDTYLSTAGNDNVAHLLRWKEVIEPTDE